MKVGDGIEKREMIKMKYPVWEVRVVPSEVPLEAGEEAGAEEEAEAEETQDVWHEEFFLSVKLDELWKN